MKIRLLVMSLQLIKRLELSCAEQTGHCSGVRKLELRLGLLWCLHFDFDRLCFYNYRCRGFHLVKS